MNHDFIIKTTNRVAIYAATMLVYWVFAYLAITIFDLKIFKVKITEAFSLSVFGIFVILGGAIVLNVMSNLSKISSAVSSSAEKSSGEFQGGRMRFWLLGFCFPLVLALLFMGDHLSAERKKEQLLRSLENFVAENKTQLKALADYKFTPEYVRNAEKTLNVLNKIDGSFPEVMVIFADSIDGKAVYLGFGGRGYHDNDQKELEKSTYIYSASREEREYLESVFTSDKTQFRFHAYEQNYQLYFPTRVDGKKFVLYVSDFQRYGRFSS